MNILKISTITATAFAAGLTLTNGVYAADVTVYGKANVSINNNDFESGSAKDNWELVSNLSNLGVKGSHQLEEGLKAIYQIELEINFDDGDKGGQTITQRNTFVGLQGGFGRLKAGKFDSPTKSAQGKIDRFNNLSLGDIKNVFEGENRPSNIVQYSTPDMGNFSLKAAFIPGEDNDDDGDNGLADGYSVALKYKMDNLTLGLAGDSEISDTDVLRFVAEYTMGATKLGFMYQSAELSDEGVAEKEDEDGFLFSGEHKLNKKVVLKAQYAYNEIENFAEDVEKTNLIVGADYKFNKSARLFTYYSMIETDADISEDTDDSVLAVGFELKF